MRNLDLNDLTKRLRAHVEHLAGRIGDRSALNYSQLEEARGYIEHCFGESGYEIQHDAFEVEGQTFRNVIAEPQTADSEGVLVVGAHYDTVPGTPGADDNAAAVAVMLEAARLLRGGFTPTEVRWVAFVLEEPPYFRTRSMGSWVHARKCRARGDNLVGMISLEMVGYYRDEPRSQHYPLPLMRLVYPDAGNFVAVAGNFRSRRLVSWLAGGLRKAGTIPVESIALPFVPGIGLSDNWAFWKEGFSALMLTDTAFFRNPNYHLPTDTPETLDYDRMALLCSGLAAALSGDTR